MSKRNFWTYREDFITPRTFTATRADSAILGIKDTSAAGSPTYAQVTPSNSGELSVQMAATSEAEILTAYFFDDLPWKASLLQEFYFRVKMNQASVNAATIFVGGLASAQNDTADSVAANIWFRVDGGGSTTNVVLETDDGTTDNDDKATGTTLINAYKEFFIDFSKGLSDIRFFIDWQPVGAITFSASLITGSLQPFFQIQKASGTNTDGFTLDCIEAVGRRY